MTGERILVFFMSAIYVAKDIINFGAHDGWLNAPRDWSIGLSKVELNAKGGLEDCTRVELVKIAFLMKVLRSVYIGIGRDVEQGM